MVIQDQNHRKRKFQFVAIVISGLIALLAVIPFDYDWTAYLNENEHTGFKQFMSDSVFELEPFGGGDIAFIYIVLMAVAYLISYNVTIHDADDRSWWMKVKRKLVQWRHLLGFHVIAGLCTAVFLVHPLKWIIGRPRPYKVFFDGYEYSGWYEVGAHFVSEGWYHGSFPSGHTATVFVFIALAYVLIHSSSKKLSIAGWVVGFFAFTSASAMLIARSMAAAHWVSDSMFSIFGAWAITHLLYFFGLNVPARSEYLRKNCKQLHLPSYYELRISWYLFVGSLGFLLCFFGIRAAFRWEVLLLTIGIPLGAFLVYYGIRKARKLGFFKPYDQLQTD